MNERNFVFIVNPISGTVSKEGIIEIIQHKLIERKIVAEILHTNQEGNYGWLAEKMVEDKITDMVIVGGDGTVNQIINALRHLPIRFGIIPVGSGNGLSNSAGIPTRPTEALKTIFEGEAKWIDGFLINNEFSCMLSGLGFDAQVAHDFAQNGTRGLLAYTQQSLLNIFKAPAYHFEVTYQDTTFSTEAFFISIANSNQFGNNITIAPNAALNDGLLDIVIVQKMNKAILPFALIYQMQGSNHLQTNVENQKPTDILYFQTNALTINNPEFAPLHIDGEPYETANHFQIEVLPKCFQLIC